MRNSGWSTTPTGAVAYSRDTPATARARERRRGRGPRPRASPRCRRRSPPAPRMPERVPRPARLPSLDSGAMAPVTVLILAPEPAADAGPLRADPGRRAGARSPSTTGCGFLAAGAAEAVVRREPADGTPFGARLRRLVGELRPAGLVVLGAGSIPLATAGDREAFVACRRRPTSPARSRTTATRRTSSRSPGAGEVLASAARTSPPTTRCRAGSRRPPPSPSATSRRGGGWRWTSTRRSTSLLLEGARGAPRLPGPDRRVGGPRPRPPGGAARARGGPGRGAARRRPDLGHRPALARAPHAVADPGPGRGAGPADVARPAPSSGARTGGRPGACSASCWSGTARRRSGGTSRPSPTAR